MPDSDPEEGPIDQAALNPEFISLIELVAQGLTDKSISDRLGVSIPTVQRRLKRVADLLGVDSRVSLVVRAAARGLIDPGSLDSSIRTRPSGDQH